MIDQERKQFMARLTVLAEVMAEPMSEARIVGYTALLDEYPLEDLAPALEACAKTCRFFPRPVDISDAVAGVRYEREQARTRTLLAAYREPAGEGITEAQWLERWAALKRVFANAPQKPHRPLIYPCHCNDCTREHREKPKPLVPPCYCPECVSWEAQHAAR